MNESKTYTVSEINSLVRKTLDENALFSSIKVTGEISNFKRYSSGHCYFSLKDENSVLKCVMFRSRAQRLLKLPNNGDQMICVGRLGVYEHDGAYQLYVDLMLTAGRGDLRLRYEALRDKLAAEGLFDETRKRMLPKYPRVLGVVTSPSGAVIHDIITNARRRFPGIKIRLYPVQVQGEGAAREIANAIRFMNRLNLADVLIVGRGGGSLEDLWAFNEEQVVRAVADSKIPVIASVGHDKDVTLTDFAADITVSTPTGAAVTAVPVAAELAAWIDSQFARGYAALRRGLERREKEYRLLVERRLLRDPKSLLDLPQERLDKARMRIVSSSEKIFADAEARVKNSLGLLRRMEEIFGEAETQRFESDSSKMQNAFKDFLVVREHALEIAAAKLDAVSPLKVLARGYSLTRDKRSKTLTSVQNVHWGSELRTSLLDGDIISIVQEISERR